MQQRVSTIFMTGFAALMMISAVPVYAELAPVYDVDTLQDDQYASNDEVQDAPPPPPPESGFVPAQQYTESAPAAEAPKRSSKGASNQRVKQMEEEIKTLKNSEANQRADALQEEVQALRNQVEQLTHQLDKMKTNPGATDQSNQDGLIADGVNSSEDDGQAPKATPPHTVKAASAKATAKAGAIAAETKPPERNVTETAANQKDTTPDDQPDVAEEQQIYQTAYNLIKEKKYSEAAGVLQDMLKKYPSGQFASNSHYWLGELYVLMDKNDMALKEFNTVIDSYPKSPRVSDAQLKVGIIYAAQAKWTDAKDSFKKVINLYPGTASSRVASEQLKQIKQAGH